MVLAPFRARSRSQADRSAQPGSAMAPGSLSALAVGLSRRSNQPSQGVSQVSSGQSKSTGETTNSETIDQDRGLDKADHGASTHVLVRIRSRPAGCQFLVGYLYSSLRIPEARR